jgi:transposase-like protein
MNLVDVMNEFSTDEKCRELLKRLRWPDGAKCPRCHDSAVELETAKDLLFCNRCQYQFTATAGTIFHDSHLPLSKWFITTLLLCESRKGMSANQIKRTIGVSYKTAWYLCHRIRAAMSEARKEPLYGKVEMDETYVGAHYSGRRGRGSLNKEVVIGIRQRGGPVRFFHAADVKTGTLAQCIRDNIGKDLDVMMTDDFAAYPYAVKRAGIDPSKHRTINHSSGVYVKGDIHTNTVESAFSLLKRGIIGTWHRISAKHLQAYLKEMEFRFNRRNNDDLFLDTLQHMVCGGPLG